MELNQEKIEAAIVADAVAELVSGDNLYERVKKGVEARIDSLFETKVSALVEDMIDRVFKEGLEHEYTKRDGFGRPVGEPTTISNELENLISDYWRQKVDRQGKPTDSGYHSVTRAEWMMTQLCADDFSKEMKQHVVNVSGALKDHFRAVLDEHVSRLLSEVFHVRSQGDQDKRRPGRSKVDPPAKPEGQQ